MMEGKERLRLLMVITTLDVGGAEKHLLLLADGLVQRGHHLSLVYLKGEGTLAPRFTELGVPVEKISFEKITDLPGAVLKLARKVRSAEVDAVHSHLLKADLLTALARPRVWISSKHNDERALLNPVVSRVHGLISKRAARVIVLSDHVGRFMMRHGRVKGNKILRIYYGLDPAAFCPSGANPDRIRERLGLKEGIPLIIMVARFAEQKDHATLLESARLLKEEGRAFRLLLVGGDPFGDRQERTIELAERLGLSDRVVFAGIRHDVPDLLALSQIFVMPSLWEGLGLVFLEAMAHALPVVSNRVSAVPEIVEDGVTGLLVQPRDPAGLKEALARLLDDPALRSRFGRAGYERLVSHFGVDRMVGETLDVYRDCRRNKGIEGDR
jgi:glycosyltransferase involved in cell wall biosynthesis